MNHRLDDLYEQAYVHKPLMVANPQTFEIEHKVGNGGQLMYTREFDPETFAELIVKECAKVAHNAHGVTIGQGYNVSQQIKKHFGVEK